MDEEIMRCAKIGRWRAFLDSLATTGGHIFILVFLILTGTAITIFGEYRGYMVIAEIGKGMEGLSLGALMMMYKPSGTNAEQVAREGRPYQPPQPPMAAPPAGLATTLTTTATTVAADPAAVVPGTVPGAGSAAPDGPERVELK